MRPTHRPKADLVKKQLENSVRREAQLFRELTRIGMEVVGLF